MPRLNRFSPGSPWAHCQARGPGLGLYFVRRVRSHDATICPLSGRALLSRSGNAPFRRPLSGSSRHFLFVSFVDHPSSGLRPDVRVPGALGQHPARPGRSLSFRALFVRSCLSRRGPGLEPLPRPQAQPQPSARPHRCVPQTLRIRPSATSTGPPFRDLLSFPCLCLTGTDLNHFSM